ncbi:MAG TPA: hypothetical protein VLD63_14275, partial [Anaerolineales bacterium]|nr:hypothetical protein [Anaerolineales bacterium]
MSPKSPIAPAVERFSTELHHIDTVLQIAIRGVQATIAAPQALKALAEWSEAADEPEKAAEYTDLVPHAQTIAEFAQSESEMGYDTLHKDAVVALWSALEVMAHDITLARISAQPTYLEGEPFAQIKLPLAEFHQLGDADRLELLLREMRRRSSPRAAGATALESLLSTVGMGGPVPEPMARVLYELHQTRNLIVHRGGIVDTTFLKRCPWAELKKGDRLTVGHDKYIAFMDAAAAYFHELL